MLRAYERDAEELLHGLGENMLEQGPPRQIIVTDDRTYSFLEEFASAVQIELVQSAGNELLEDLEETFFCAMGFGGLEEAEGGGFPGMVEELLADGDEEMLLSIPGPVWEGLRQIMEEEEAPAGIRARFNEIDRKRRL